MTHFGHNKPARIVRMPEDPLVADARRMAREQFWFGLGVGLVLAVVVIGSLLLATN